MILRSDSWDLLGLGKISKQNFLLTCSLIALGIFLIVVVFAIFIFFVEAQEFKGKIPYLCRRGIYPVKIKVDTSASSNI